MSPVEPLEDLTQVAPERKLPVVKFLGPRDLAQAAPERKHSVAEFPGSLSAIQVAPSVLLDDCDTADSHEDCTDRRVGPHTREVEPHRTEGVDEDEVADESALG